MSVHLYPKTSERKLKHIGELVNKLLDGNINPQKVDKIVEHITYAHMCGIVESVLESSALRNLHTFDPDIVKELEAALLKCR